MSIDANQLAAYMDGALPPDERAIVELHLAGCPDCREIVGGGVPLADEPASVTPLPAPRRKPVWIGRAAVTLAAAAAVVFMIRLAMPDRSGAGLAQLRDAAGTTRPFDARLTGGFAYRPVESITRSVEQPSVPADLRLAAALLEKEAQASPTAENLHAFGDAQILTRDVDGAIRSLESASALARTDGHVQVDLAAAYVARGRQQNAAADYWSALAALDRAGSQQRSAEALFNRALAFEGLGRRSDARDAWQRYVAVDSQSGWAAEARTHLAALDSPNDSVR